jgi:hypothetical protein
MRRYIIAIRYCGEWAILIDRNYHDSPGTSGFSLMAAESVIAGLRQRYSWKLRILRSGESA